MKKLYLGLISSLLLTACSQAQWVKPGATEQEFEKNYAECNYEATKAVPDYGSGSLIAIALQRAEIIKQCLRLKGYSQQRTN